jgi:hypothetical protein
VATKKEVKALFMFLSESELIVGFSRTYLLSSQLTNPFFKNGEKTAKTITKIKYLLS